MRKITFLLTILILSIRCAAATLTVPTPYSTIQSAIDMAAYGDTVQVAAGTYVENITLKNGVALIGAGDATTTIDGNASGSVVASTDCDPNTLLDGFTITNGDADDGGGMFNNSSSPTITDCIFVNNLANLGGGICNLNNSNPMLLNCSFTGNLTPPWGEGCGGNGVYNNQSSPTLVDCIFYENSGGSYGGGMFNENSSPTLTNCSFRENTGYRYGGGIANFSNSNPTLTNCTFSSGSSRIGGGICNYYNSNPTLTNCTFTDNSAEWGGGGMNNYQSSSILTNCTFIKNAGNDYDGGGMHNHSSSSTLRNCIFWDNTASNGNEIALSSSTIDIDYSDVQGGLAGIYDDLSGNTINWGLGNIDTDPLFVETTSSDPNDWDFHLKSQGGRWDPNTESWVTDTVTSPCIDAGNPGCPIGDEPTYVTNVRRNMGAYGGTTEASKTPMGWGLLCDVNNDWSVNTGDLNLFVQHWLDYGECIPADFSRGQGVNWLDFGYLYVEWLDVRQIIEPELNFQIEACDMGGKSPSAVDGLDDLRFTVAVEGSNILFEDMMVANCCPDELWLEMTVNGDTITIYERELLTFPCFCICDYPVNATLGPFDSGTYTIEVYEDFGGFIGTTTVIIE